MLSKLLTTFSMALAITALSVTIAVAAQSDKATAATPAPQARPAQQTAPVTYKYTAQANDSYSLIARKAVQTYGKKFKVNLNQGQILFAETNMTRQAGSPHLALGQAVSVNETTVKDWVEKARKLSTAEVAAWNAYLPGVNFNTNNVGE